MRLFLREEMEVAVFSDDKQTRENNIAEITDKLKGASAEKRSGRSGEAAISIRRRVR